MLNGFKKMGILAFCEIVTSAYRAYNPAKLNSAWDDDFRSSNFSFISHVLTCLGI